MLDLSSSPNQRRSGHVQVFTANGNWPSSDAQIWYKPRGISMVTFFGVGGGGGGGDGSVGASGSAGGGGGGSSAAQTVVTIAAWLLPDILYVVAGTGGVRNQNGGTTFVTIDRDTSVTNNRILLANAGQKGNTAAGGGTGGSAPSAAAMSQCPLAGMGLSTFFGGGAGGAGGSTGIGGLPATPGLNNGLRAVAGSGGGGLPASGVSRGGHCVQSTPYPFPEQLGGTGVPRAGYQPVAYPPTWYPGCGGASGDGAGGNAYNGADGATGCGGGGGGGALTGYSAGLGGRGGDGIVIISCW